MSYKKETKAKRIIEVGEFIPSSLSYWYDGGSGSLNLSSGKYDAVFKREYLKLTGRGYQFSDYCRDENEKNTFYNAVEICLGEYGHSITWI